MSEKPPIWADGLLTVWVIVVGVTYFGGYFLPALGALTASLAAVYGLLLLASAATLALRFLRRDSKPDARRPNRK